MPEDITQANAQAATPASQQPQAGTPPSNETTTPQAGGTQTESRSGMTLEAALEELAKTRREAAQHRTKLKSFEDAKAQEELAKLGELEKATKQLETTTKQLETYRQRIASMAVQMAARDLGIIDPEVAATLIQSKLELDSDGAPTNATELLKDLLKAKPYLKAQATEPAQQQQTQQPRTPSAGATNPGRGTPANPTGQQQQNGQPRTLARFGLPGQQLFQK